ncbi:MAG: Fe-S metabolism protein SufE [Verrucomicrobiaceae bacterium]|nr:Fe-S metabolism protein SufE [Verrucomicrobiaceae bacterium]
MNAFPEKLEEILELFEHLPETERREMLISFSENTRQHEPREGETFDLEDVRKDDECTDEVGVFLNIDDQGGAHFRVKLGPKVQTLTRAMTAILCQGLDGSSPQAVQEVPQDFVPRIVGSELVRLRSQTVYYVLTRMKSACAVYLKRERAAI